MAGTSALETVREDDFVEYFIFPAINANDNEEISLKNTLESVNNVIKKLTKDYLWHKDEFNLGVRTEDSNVLNEDPNTGKIMNDSHNING